MNQKSNISFSPQSNEEKMSKFRNFLKKKENLCTAWIKGQTQRFFFQMSSFVEEKNQISLLSLNEKHISDGFYCLAFEISGVSYFIQGNLSKYGDGRTYLFQVSETLYKGERRNSFRLMTYPARKVKAYIHFENEELAESNLIDFKTKLSRTGLFKNFLKLLESEEQKKKNEGYFIFLFQNISEKDIAIIVGKSEEALFEKNQIVKNIIIHFEDEEIEIPEAEVIYKSDSQQKDRNNLLVYKVGARFLNLDLNTDQKLVRKINLVLGQFDEKKLFEDFLK